MSCAGPIMGPERNGWILSQKFRAKIKKKKGAPCKKNNRIPSQTKKKGMDTENSSSFSAVFFVQKKMFQEPKHCMFRASGSFKNF